MRQESKSGSDWEQFGRQTWFLRGRGHTGKPKNPQAQADLEAFRESLRAITEAFHQGNAEMQEEAERKVLRGSQGTPEE